MCPCKWKAEIDYFLGNRLDRMFGKEVIVQEWTNNEFTHMRKETIEFEKISDNFKLGVEIFIARTEIEHAMNKAGY